MPPTFATATDTGRVRRTNEDALFARPPVFMVADGMGGPQGGEVASAVTAKAFEWYCPQGGAPDEELTKLVQKINASIFQLALAEGRPGMGTTVTAAMITDGSVVLAHVGDSRGYLWRGGKLTQLTEDHSLVAEMVRSGKISPQEAQDHPQRSVITRALGVDETVEVDTRSVAWEPGDLFLLCSDGLYSMLPDGVVAAVLGRGESLDVTAGALVGKANDRGGHDNISVVLFCPDGSIPGVRGADADTGVIRLPDEASSGAAADGHADVDGAFIPAPPRVGLPRRVYHWLFKTTPGLVLTGVLITLVIIGGGWLGTRQLYFLGVADGRIAIFRGVPYSLGPLDLFSEQRRSPLKVDDLAPYEQDQVARQEIHTLGSAEKILNNYSTEVRTQKEQANQQAAQNAKTTGTTSTLPSLSGGSGAGASP